MKGPLLFTYMCHDEGYDERAVSNYTGQLMSALAWLHGKEIAHMDVKVRSPATKCGKQNLIQLEI